VSRRPLVFVSALTVGDYVLWNWSLSGDHAVLALLAGLTLPPLALACLWLLAVGLARLIAGASRRRPAVTDAGARRQIPLSTTNAGVPAAAAPRAGAGEDRAGDPRKLAA
jgi:hypothetical protein